MEKRVEFMIKKRIERIKLIEENESSQFYRFLERSGLRSQKFLGTLNR